MSTRTTPLPSGRAASSLVAATLLILAAQPATAAAPGRTILDHTLVAAPVSKATSKPLKASKRSLGSIAAPADQALRKRAAGPVKVRLDLAKGARLAALRLNGVDVTDRAVVRGRTATARLGISGPLRPGANGLLARFVRDRRQSFDSSRFTLTRNASGLIRLSSPGSARRPAGPIPIRVRMKPKATLTAWLNDRRVTGRLSVYKDGTRRARLGPSAGLDYGKNTVRVRALMPNGRTERNSSVVRVRKNGPLADAGADQRTDTRTAIRLDGRKSVRKPAARDVEYAWRLTRSPYQAAATLTGKRTARPTFAATTPGTYVLANTTRSGGSAATDKVTVSVSPSASVQPVTMSVQTGSSGTAGPGIAVGSAFYPSDVTGPGMQLLVLERATLALTTNESYPPGQMQALNQFLVNSTTQADSSEYLYVLAALPGGSPVSSSADLNQLIIAVQWLGFQLPDPQNPDSAIDASEPFYLVGIPDPVNSDQGTAWHMQGALDGVFIPDINNNWTFNTGDYPAFDTGGTGITLGDTSWPTPSGNGFQVVVADPVSLAGSSSFFAVPGQIQQFAQAMQLAVNQDQILALRSVGTLPDLSQAGSQSDAGSFAQLTASLQSLGGSPSVFMGLGPGDAYSFVGPTRPDSFPAEGSTTIGGDGSVTGLLSRTPQGGDYAPMAADPTGNADFAQNLSSIALQPAVPWPASSSPGQQAALAYLSQQMDPGCDVSPCDVRTEYDNLDYQTQWTGLVSTLKGISYPCRTKGVTKCKKPDFSKTEFRQVQAQLAKEFPLVDDVWSLLGTNGTITQIYTQTQGSSVSALGQAVDAVDMAVAPPANTTTTTILSLVTDVMWATSLVDVEAFAAFATAAGVLAVGAATGDDLANLPSGNPYQAVADAGPVFTNDIVDHLSSTMLGVGLLGSFVVQDWGRLSAVGSQAAGPWGMSTATFDALSQGAVAGAVQNMYSALLPVAYDAYYFTPPPGTGQTIGQCQPAWWNDALPWKGAAGTASYLNLVAPPVTGVEPDAGLDWYALWEVGKSPTYWAGPTGGPPPGSLMNPLYQQFSFDYPQNAGLYAPWFWGRTYLSAQSPTPKKLDCKYRTG